MTTAFDLDSFLPFRLAVLSAQVGREFATVYRSRFGISVAEWRIVVHLAREGPASVREIHARVDLEKSRISRAAARLNAAGYVEKSAHPDDGRLVVLALSDAGREMLAELVPLANAYQADLLERLGSGAPGFCAGLDRLTGLPDHPPARSD